MLLCRCAEGDETAFGRVFHAYHQRLGAYVFRLTGSKPATQEIVQDVFVRIWVRRATLAEIDNFDAYLFTAVRNHVFNYLRNIARERTRQAALEAEQLAAAAVLQSVDTTADDDYHSLLDEAVAQLPQQQQRVYRLHKQEGLSHAEIAARMQLSVETVKKHMSLALRTIRDHLSMSRLTG